MAAARIAALKEEIQRLACERDGIEARVSESRARLAATGVGMEQPLVDAAGFPLPGLDLHAVREDRHRVIVLSNDHKAVSKRIDAALQDLHAAAQAAGVAGGPEAAAAGAAVAAPQPPPRAEAARPHPPPRSAPPPLLRPGRQDASAVGFAVVDEVSPGSPAAAAGLRPGDRVLAVGDATTMAAVPGAVAAAAAAGGSLPCSLLREGAAVGVVLSPRAGWGGAGVLGCRLRPV